MWDFSGRGRDLQLQPQIHHISRSRSRSPHPPPLRSPSPAFPISFPSSQYSPSPYQYGATLSPSYVPPPSPYSAPYGSRDFPVLSRSISSAPVAPQTPRYVPQNIQPQVVHVVHHRSSNHKLHKKHHSHGHAYMIQNQEYTQGPATPITPSVSYQSAPPTGHHHHSNNMQQRQRKHSHGHGHSPNTSQVRFSTRPEEIPQTSLKPLPRTRVHSQPTLPSAMRPGTSQAYVSTPTHVHRPIAATTAAQYPDPTNPRFQYSTCTGRKKALCVGINYRGQVNELRGCINDARNVRDFLIRHGGYNKGDIVLLTDDAEDPRSLPTRANIIDAMRWLVYHAHQNDSLFFHYSGHGGQTKDLDRDEVDGFDEVIYPMDFKSAGHIVDDEMHDIMVKPLPPGCRLTGLFDACHSGTVLDLPYIYSSHGRLKGSHVSDRARKRKATPADVISWSGCRDNQTSADTFKDQVAVGAMSHAFVSSLKNNPHQTYQELLRSIRLILHPRYSQKPQLGSSHHIDTNLQFVF